MADDTVAEVEEKPYISPNDAIGKDDKGREVIVAQSPAVIGARITKMQANGGLRDRPVPTGYIVKHLWEDMPNVLASHKVGEKLTADKVDVPEFAVNLIVARSEKAVAAAKKKDPKTTLTVISREDARAQHIALLVQMGMLEAVYPAKADVPELTTDQTGGADPGSHNLAQLATPNPIVAVPDVPSPVTMASPLASRATRPADPKPE